MPVRFETAEGDVRIEGVLFETDGSGHATSCETFRISVE
jgi:calcineurin-like phosphoesterase